MDELAQAIAKQEDENFDKLQKQMEQDQADVIARERKTEAAAAYKELHKNDVVDWKQFFDWKEDRFGNAVISRFVSKRLGDFILKDMPVITLKDNERIYRYDDGVYREDGEPTVKNKVKQILAETFTQARQNETLAYIRAATYKRNDEIKNHDWVNLVNGLLNPLTGEFIDHTPDIFTIGRTPITYNPMAECPFWLQKLGEKVDQGTVDVLQEMFGYLFQRGQKYEVAFLFYGPPRTMKSTVLHMAEQVIGIENIQAFPLQQLNDDHFSVAYLYGKRANICADLDSYSLKSTGKFMQLVGGDVMTAGRKHEHAMTFYPDCKLLFSCNVIPGTSNKDLSFYRRWIILEFEKQTAPEDIDPEMKEKLHAELPGILNWAVDGLRRLEANKKFSYWNSPEQVKDLYERASDSVSSFILNCIELSDDGEKVTKRDVYANYMNYCKKLRLNKLSPVWFGRDFMGHTGCGSSRLNDIPAYVGIHIKGMEKPKTAEEKQAERPSVLETVSDSLKGSKEGMTKPEICLRVNKLKEEVVDMALDRLEDYGLIQVDEKGRYRLV